MSCTPVEVTFADEGWVVNSTEIVLSSIFGIIVGIFIALLCVRCFFRELAKARDQKSSNVVMMEGSTNYKSSVMPSLRNLENDKMPVMNIKDESDTSSQKTKSRMGNSSDDEEGSNKMENFDADSLNQKINGDGLIVALANTGR
ncbi:uncharacterized protein LOC117102145 isoform X1 [Anneissia japonica]|uniref:uncharacterized protein LOC117102145 isoform X1 n=1 Tax=Anneissia japonica TaxID=1529436 RepID=UPI001425A939|nr:uncharacterized protein LOC117102145 isoform X1 [Anneissia japonica]XP_033098245.1 uncharacterized protein LOC117102145 isoform X1 [Anneissia japonica]